MPDVRTDCGSLVSRTGGKLVRVSMEWSPVSEFALEKLMRDWPGRIEVKQLPELHTLEPEPASNDQPATTPAPVEAKPKKRGRGRNRNNQNRSADAQR